jgi:hypothetical protein
MVVEDVLSFCYSVSIFSMCIYSGRYGPDLQELLCRCLCVPYEPAQFWILSVSRAVRCILRATMEIVIIPLGLFCLVN